jgi:hypothetical protein
MFENVQQLEKKLEQKMTKLMTERFELKSNQTRSDLEISRKTVSNTTKSLENSKQTHQTAKTSQTAKSFQIFEKSQTNSQINSSSTSSFI